MHKALKISTILSWINLIIGGIMVIGGLIFTLASTDGMIALLSVVLTGSIVLHSYATLQLRKSIMNENIPLSNQTPTGIRLVGFMALFFSILNIGNSIVIFQNAEQVLEQVKVNLPYKTEKMDLTAIIRGIGVFYLLFSAGIAVNVFLSIRLLRWYLAGKEE